MACGLWRRVAVQIVPREFGFFGSEAKRAQRISFISADALKRRRQTIVKIKKLEITEHKIDCVVKNVIIGKIWLKTNLFNETDLRSTRSW